MKTENKKIITAVLMALLLLSGAGMYKLHNDSEGYKQTAQAERLKQDSLLATKQLLDKEVFILKGKNTDLTNKIVSLNDSMEGIKSNLLNKDKEIASITNKIAKLKSSEKQLADSKNTIADLESKLAVMQSEKSRWLSEKEGLNQTIADLNNQLAQKSEARLVAENLRIEVLKRNPVKLTVKARQIRSILISFNIDSKNRKSQSLSSVYVSITTPDGKSITGKENKKVTIPYNGQPQEITAVKIHPVDVTKTQRITIPVEIVEKIKERGIYKIELFSNDGLLGSAEFRLM